MLAEQGQWQRCLDKAKQISSPVLHKYVALYAAQLIRDSDSASALGLYMNYGAPPLEANFNIYTRIALDCFAQREEECQDGLWRKLRDFLYKLLQVNEILKSVVKVSRVKACIQLLLQNV